MIFIIILAIVLIGLVTAALRSGGLGGAGIDSEDMVIKASQVRQHAAELERGVAYVMQNGLSESSDLSFAYTDAPSDYGTFDSYPRGEVFNTGGGGAAWRVPPAGVTATGSVNHWEFYGTTAIPGAGTDSPELIAVLPDVTPEFCAQINKMNGQDAQQPTDDGTCLAGGTRFAPAAPPASAFSATPNTMNDASFSKIPALEACVQCGTTPGDPLHFYHVLMVR